MKALGASERVNLMLRACSDPIRLRVLHILAGGELRVADLVEVLRAPQPTISRHLAYLRRAGLVRARREGAASWYALAPARGAFHGKLLECIACCLGEVPGAAEDAKRAARLRRPAGGGRQEGGGGCCG